MAVWVAYTAVAIGLLQSLYVLQRRPFGSAPLSSVHAIDVAASPFVPCWLLLCWRVAVLVWWTPLTVEQLQRQGSFVWKFYTLWNWWLLGLFFLLAALQTLRHMAVRHNGKRDTAKAPLLARCTVVMLHINVTTSMLIMVVTWTVLVPMLLRDPDPKMAQFYAKVFYSWTSYNQHGVNMAVMMVEMLLNGMPFMADLVGYVGIWSSIYGMWAIAWHAISGLWLYPFLDTKQPWAPVAYLGLVAAHWVFFAVAALMHWLGSSLLRRSPRHRKLAVKRA